MAASDYQGPERRGTPATTQPAPERPDRRSPIRRLLSLVVGETVTTFVRWVSLVLAGAMTLLGWDPLFNPDDRAYQNPVFNGVFTAAHPTVWGLMFLVGATALLLTAITARAVVYVFAIVYSSSILAGWASMVVYEVWTNPDASITSGAYGLYMFSFTALVGLAFSPRQLDAERPIVAVTDAQELQPLKIVS